MNPRFNILCSLIFMLSACTRLLIPAEVPTDNSLLDADECSFPCWHGLIPGQSNLQDVQQQLKDIDFVPQDNIHETTEGNRTIIQWWHTIPQEQSRLVIKDNILKAIEIFPHLDFTLQDVLSTYGDPSGLSSRAEKSADGILIKIYIYYKKLGAVIQFQFNQGYDEKSKIDGSLSGKEFYLFEPTDTVEEFISSRDELDGQTISMDRFVEWQHVSLPFWIMPNPDSIFDAPIITTIP